jgi:pimeloyl-ACP methyl ester carboxylesterase
LVAAEAAVRRVEIGDGASLSIAEAGAGGRPLVLVHGFGAAKEDFTGVLSQLAARGWHAVSPDMRGHGDTGGPDDEGAYPLAGFGADLHGLADALGWSRFAALGHSAGGMFVQEAVALDPRRFDALVLMDTWTGPFEGIAPDLIDLAVTICRTEGMGALQDALDALDGGPLTTPAYNELIARDPDHDAFSRRKLAACVPAMYAALAQQLPSARDHHDLLARLDLPALVLVGEQDKPFLDACAGLAEAIPGARHVVLPDAGHSPQFENPDAWWAALSSFLDDVAAGAR